MNSSLILTRLEKFEGRIPYMYRCTGGEVTEQVIRPTGLLDPMIHIKPARGQVPHLLEEIKKRAAVGERTLVTTLTKRLAEDLSFYLAEQGVKCKWLHSELDAFERVELLQHFDLFEPPPPPPQSQAPKEAKTAGPAKAPAPSPDRRSRQ